MRINMHNYAVIPTDAIPNQSRANHEGNTEQI